MPDNLLTRALTSARLGLSDPAMRVLIRDVRRRKLTYLSSQALTDLYDAVRQLEARQAAGVIIEAGVALGGSAIILARSKARERSLELYDVFGMIPPPSASDGPDAHARYAEIASGKSAGIQGDHYYGYEDGLLTKVQRNLEFFGVELAQERVRLYPGLFEDTLRVDEPVALAHIDCDWYESVMLCLERITPHLVVGGMLVIDDYRDWSGCKRAVDEFFAGREDEFRWTQRARLRIERTR